MWSVLNTQAVEKAFNETACFSISKNISLKPSASPSNILFVLSLIQSTTAQYNLSANAGLFNNSSLLVVGVK